MRLDHVSYAAGPDGLAATARRLGDMLGEPFIDGGIHPRFGTRNMVLPLRQGMYIEIVEALDHPASDKAPFGQAVKARCEYGGGWLGWVVSVDDLAPVERRLGRAAAPGNRYRPDGHELKWRQIGVKGLQADPQLPFFVKWEGDGSDHPSLGASGATQLSCLEIGGDPLRVSEWLGRPVEEPLDDIKVHWVGNHGVPGVIAAQFDTPSGHVRI